MNNSVTFGQYIPTNSFIHRLDPRYKIMTVIIMIAAIFTIPASNNWFFLTILGGILLLILLLIIIAKIPIFKALSSMKPVIFLLTFTFLIQTFYFQKVDSSILLFQSTFYISYSSISSMILLTIIYFFIKKYIKFKILLFLVYVFLLFLIQYFLKWGNLTTYNLSIYDHSLIKSGYIIGRIMAVILITSLLTYTTTTTHLNYGLESLMRPFKKIKFPVETLSMMISLVFRYVPTLVNETYKIIKAQASRGVDFKESHFFKKIKQVISLLIPIFLISFKRAEELADAMLVRGYVIGSKRSKIDIFKVKFYDIFHLILSLSILSSIIALRFIV